MSRKFVARWSGMIAFTVLTSILPNLVLADSGTKSALSLDALSNFQENVQEHTLPNGLKILFYRRSTAPVFAGVVSVRVGGVDEQLGKTGASHLFEHLAFKGTPEIGTSDYKAEKPLLELVESLYVKEQKLGELDAEDQKSLQSALDKLQKLWRVTEFSNVYAKWGAVGMNATTAKELTNYFASFPNTSFEFWCWIESQRLTRTVPRQFFKERDVVLEERRSRYENSPSGKLYEKTLANAFVKHPYRNPVIGYESDIKNILPTDVMALHQKYYVASNIVVSIVGDLSFKESLPTIEKYFGRVPDGVKPNAPQVQEPKQDSERKFRVEHEAEPMFFAAYPKPIYPDPTDVGLSVFLEYAIGSRAAPIYRSIVQQKRMASSLGFFEAPGDMYPNLIVLYAEPIAPHTSESVLKVLDKEIRSLLAKGFSEKQIEITKRAMMKDALVGLKSNMGLARELAETEQKYGSWGTSLTWYKEMLELTPEKVKEAASKVLETSHRTIGFLERKVG